MLQRTIKAILQIIMVCACSGCSDCALRSTSNSGDLCRLIKYYETVDTNAQKVEAVKFIADNIRWHHTVEDGESLPDEQTVDYEFLKEHIDYIFEVWHSSRFARGLSFDEFKEYLLPYDAVPGIGPNITALERAKWTLSTLDVNPADTLLTANDIAQIYNNALEALQANHSAPSAHFRVGSSNSTDATATDCAEKSHNCVLNLRSIGIPCVSERNFCYRRLKSHHVHCAIYDAPTHEFYRFNAEDSESVPDSAGWNYVEMQNIYRLTYGAQICSPFYFRQLHESVVEPFASPCLKDATRRGYQATIRVSTDSVHNIVYLATFNRDAADGLIPVTWGLVDSLHQTATFNHLLPETLYFAGVANQGRLELVDAPFYFEQSDGKLQQKYIGVENKTQKQRITVKLLRKYPIKDKTIELLNNLRGSKIQASNDSNFSSCVTLLSINKVMQPTYNHFNFSGLTPYRFYRFITPSASVDASIAELRWMDNDSTYICLAYPETFDNDMTTAPNKTNQIVLSLERPVALDQVDIVPLNAGNSIMSGHQYQLNYFDDKTHKWQSLATVKAVTDSIEFANVPSGALLWLIDKTAGSEEMPFKYIEGKQVFLYPELINVSE
jgi:hypothetical protein